MLSIEIIEPDYPTLNLSESTVGEALAMHEEKNFLSFPVLNDGELEGILPVKDILHLPENKKINSLQNLFAKASVQENEYFFSAFKIMNITGLDIVPVTDERQKYTGTITQQSLLNALDIFLNIQDGNKGIIVLEMEQRDYSFSELAGIVESCDADIVRLNTYFDVKTGLFIVALKINRTEISEIIAALQQRDYHVAYYFGEEKFEEEIRHNYDALMNYLSI